MRSEPAPLLPRDGNGAAIHDDGAASRPAGVAVRNAPVIVLTFPYSGAERWRSVLDSHPELACTSGTGILPLCGQAADAWRAADGQSSGRLSPLAISSVRALASGIITCILARTGKRRWCEFAVAPPSSAATFRELFPGTRFLCLHRACADVIAAALHASPWGLANPRFAPFVAAYPGSAVAALTAYWTACTQQLLDLEEAHPDWCQRVRYEDLDADPHAEARVFGFLGLETPGPGSAGPAADAWPGAGTSDVTPSGPGPRSAFPADQIPPPLLAKANGLMRRLGYPPLPSRR